MPAANVFYISLAEILSPDYMLEPINNKVGGIYSK